MDAEVQCAKCGGPGGDAGTLINSYPNRIDASVLGLRGQWRQQMQHDGVLYKRGTAKVIIYPDGGDDLLGVEYMPVADGRPVLFIEND